MQFHGISVGAVVTGDSKCLEILWHTWTLILQFNYGSHTLTLISQYMVLWVMNSISTKHEIWTDGIALLPWWLQITWCQIGPRPSATATMIWQRLWWECVYYPTCKSHYIHWRNNVRESSSGRKKRWYLVYWWVNFLKVITPDEKTMVKAKQFSYIYTKDTVNYWEISEFDFLTPLTLCLTMANQTLIHGIWPEWCSKFTI